MDDRKNDWTYGLKRDGNGNIIPSLSNISLIMNNDEGLEKIVFNEMNSLYENIGPLPWRKWTGGWQQSDFSCLQLYLEQSYGIYAPTRCKEAFTACLTTARRYHPVKNYLEALKWDGHKRIDTLLIDYLFAEDTRYTRLVTRKTLTAAVARVFNPGIKFDHVLVLCGTQGIGKSTLFSMLGKQWYSDSMTISDMKDKTASEKLQGVWIMELGELAGLRKVDVEIVKSFITRQTDTYRPAYGQYVENHKRACVIVGTTNANNGFLRDISGNRRFWPVKVKRQMTDPWKFPELDVDQIWAEAYHAYMDGETLFLESNDEALADMVQREEMEVDPRAGIIEEYLKNPSKTEVCLMEIWCECLRRQRQDMKKRDAYEIEAVLKKTGEWELYSGNSSGKSRTLNYGIQRVFVRKEVAYDEEKCG